MIHHASVSRAFSDRESMLPHETTSIGRPMPRKLSVDSSVMALRLFITTMNEMDEKKFGARCCRRTWKKPPPMQREASTYSLLRSLRTSVRTTLAMLAQLVSPMTSESVSTFAVPRMACSSTTSSRFGTLSRISVSRIRRRSSQSGAQPLTVPNRMAMAVDSSVDRTPMVSEMRPPYQIMEKISRPIGSVPKRNSRDGASLQCARSR